MRSKDEHLGLDDDGRETAPLSPEDELEKLPKEWISPVYVFFEPKPQIIENDGWCAYNFKCTAKGCKVKVQQYTNTKDAQSTSNLQKHVKICKGWGRAVLKAANEAKYANEAQMTILGRFIRDGTITTAFERKGKGKVTYSHCSHTWKEARCVS